MEAYGGLGHYRLFDSDFTAFAKLWSKAENTVGDKLNMFYGIGYLGFADQQYFFKPYVALHHISIDYVSPVHGSANGQNGYIVGWMAGYNFNNKLSLTNWTDIQLGRNDAYTESFVAQGHDYGLSGGLSLKWKFNPNFSASFTYSYYLNEMAFDGWGDQLIYSLSYNF